MIEGFLTKAGYEKLMRDLAFLKSRQQQLTLDAAGARDSKDKTEYLNIRNQMSTVDHRIAQIQSQLRDARFFEASGTAPDSVALGCTVTVRDETGEESSYTLVNEVESDPAQGRVSAAAPLARCLMGRKIGDIVTIDLPRGSRTFKIIGIEGVR